MNGLLDYQCQVYESGYEIVTIDEFQRDRIGVVSEVEYKIDQYVRPIDPQSTRRVYNLMEHAGAYYEFANSMIKMKENTPTPLIIEKSLDDYIIKFANKYGLLTTSDHGDDKVIWISNYFNMGLAVGSLQKINNGDIEGLRFYLNKEDGKFYIRPRHVFTLSKFDDRINIPIIGQTPPRNYSEAAHHYISHLVNLNLKDSLVTEIIVNPTNTGTDMIVRPKDLLSALWLQLAHAANRNLEFKQCSDCSTFFEVKSKKRRFEKIYCSDRCRKRVSAQKRRDKEKAK